MTEVPYKDSVGREYRYGEFFPAIISPFAYNESRANEHYPLTQKEAEESGYHWKTEETANFEITLAAKDIPDHIKDASDALNKEVIGCAECGRAFRITQYEIDVCRRMNVPLPRLCFLCQFKEKIKIDPHPMRLWRRKCQCTGKGSSNGVYENVSSHFHGSSHCPNEFDCAYAPGRPEIVYCKQCYQNEVS